VPIWEVALFGSLAQELLQREDAGSGHLHLWLALAVTSGCLGNRLADLTTVAHWSSPEALTWTVVFMRIIVYDRETNTA
jgi:hypothetical protein